MLLSPEEPCHYTADNYNNYNVLNERGYTYGLSLVGIVARSTRLFFLLPMDLACRICFLYFLLFFSLFSRLFLVIDSQLLRLLTLLLRLYTLSLIFFRFLNRLFFCLRDKMIQVG